MPGKNFNDDISVLSDDKKLFSRSRSASRSRSRANSRPQSSSQSVTSSSNSTMKSSRSRRGFFRNLRSGGFGQGPDDISVSDSLCSGVLRGEFQSGNNIGGSSTAADSSSNSIGETGRSAYSAAATPPIPGGVADFNLNNFSRIPSNEHSEIGQSLTSSGTGPSMIFAESIMQDEANRRENRKERVKEKLDRYKRDQKQLKHSCVALEHQLAQTTEKLKEVDSKAAFKIDSLETELRETRVGMEQVAKQSTREVTDQSECIKALGKKLIRQAHVIKRQKSAVEQYKVQLNALQEEMTMQDERDSGRADEYCQLRDRYDSVLEQKVNLQRSLQENIEEMTDLKIEAERDAKGIRELEFNLQQKEATLKRVAKEVSEKSIRICALEEELEEKNLEVEDLCEVLKDNETSVEQMKQELESAKGEVEEWMSKYAALETSNTVSAGGGGDDNANHMSSLTSAGLSASIKGSWKRGWDDEGADPETFKAELQAKDATIQTLDDTVNEQVATIQSLESNMVKIKSTYKSDQYLKRKEIIKLTQANAEYALKYRGLEKAFKAISAPSGSNTMIGSTMHGVGGSPASRLNGSSMHGGLSRHGKSMHSVGSRSSIGSKEDTEKSIRICTLEEELEKKNLEVEHLFIILKGYETSVEQMKQELESAKGEVEEWMSKYAALETSNNVSAGGGGDDNANHMSSLTSAGRSASILGSWKRGWDGEGADPETFEAELQAKDATIQSLDDTVNDQVATIQSLKSNMVKIKSTYESDKYLKRKEIIKLTQANAEYALKYRGLEKAFKAISAPSGSNTMIGSTMHGVGGSPTSRLNGSSMHGGLSRHGKSMHSVGSRGSIDSKEDKAAAVKARLGLAPYEFPTADQLRQKESQIVVDSNFFDGSDDGRASEDGRKGEFPEEC